MHVRMASRIRRVRSSGSGMTTSEDRRVLMLTGSQRLTFHQALDPISSGKYRSYVLSQLASETEESWPNG